MLDQGEEGEGAAVRPGGGGRPAAGVMVDPLGPIVEGQRFDQLGDELATTTLATLVRASLLPRPPLVDWAGWRNWRREFGCRPPEPRQSAGMKSA